MDKKLPPEINNIDEAFLDDRNRLIVYQYLFEGKKQIDIAREFDLTQGSISQIIQKVVNDERIKHRLISLWEKEYAVEARKKALELVRRIDPENHPPSKRAVDSGILVDKARLIDGETTENIGYADFTRRIAEIDQEIEALEAELGLIEKD